MNLSNASRSMLSKVPGLNRAIDFMCSRVNQVYGVEHDNETGKHLAITAVSIASASALTPIIGNGASKLNYLDGRVGSDASAGATNIFRMNLTGINALTARDKLLVIANVNAVTADTANCRLFNLSDSVDLVAGATIVAGNYYSLVALLQRSADNNKVLFSYGYTGTGGVFGAWSGAGGGGSTLATGWTNNWIIGVRHDGVTAGGTLFYDVAVFRIAGQNT